MLLVDDSRDSLDIACTILERAGAVAVCVDSAVEAVQVFAGRHFDVVVSDLSMPGEDGFWLIEQVRQLASNSGSPRLGVIALTAHATPEVATRALEAGFDAIVTKPFLPDKLIGAVAAALSGSAPP